MHPVPGAPISLAVDASDTHIGRVLQQPVQQSWSPFTLISRKLSDTETHYSAFSAIHHFRFLLKGRDLILFTDCKPLTHALLRTTPPWSAPQHRQLSYISEFRSNIIHLPGLENSIADALSNPSAVQPSSASSSALPSALPSSSQVRISLSLAPVLFSTALPPEDQLSTLDFDFSFLPP